MRRFQPGHRDTAWTGTPRLKQAAGIVEPAGSEIRLQQGEFHEVDLRAAAADAFTFAEYRLDRIDGRGKILALERRKRAGEGGNGRARRIPPGADQLLHLLG